MIKILHDGVLYEYPEVRVHITDNIYFENGGFFPNTKAVARIFTSSGIPAAVGDTLLYENSQFVIAGIRDRRRHTTVPHWKITARG